MTSIPAVPRPARTHMAWLLAAALLAACGGGGNDDNGTFPTFKPSRKYRAGGPQSMATGMATVS